jgi:Arc/MetJ family transcription regulator
MRATLNIPDDLVKEAQEATGAKTKTEAIVIALKEVVRIKKIEQLLALGGTMEIDDVSEEMEALELRETADIGTIRGKKGTNTR